MQRGGRACNHLFIDRAKARLHVGHGGFELGLLGVTTEVFKVVSNRAGRGKAIDKITLAKRVDAFEFNRVIGLTTVVLSRHAKGFAAGGGAHGVHCHAHAAQTIDHAFAG